MILQAIRARQFVLVGIVTFVSLTFILIVGRLPSSTTFLRKALPPESCVPLPHNAGGLGQSSDQDELEGAPVPDSKPLAFPRGGPHPMWQLINDAERTHEEIRLRQSRNVTDASAEYRRRYGIPPPPRFDEWFQFASGRRVQMTDEFDMIHQLITPFWGLRPETIRARAREALGYADNYVMGVQIRQGQITNIDGGKEWLQKAMRGMLQPFVHHLPDMDLAFNTHDEPRVIVPSADMDRLVRRAKTVTMPRVAAAASSAGLQREWSPRPEDMGDGRRIVEFPTTRFNVFTHQSAWSESRLACSPWSPAAQLEEVARVDDVAKYLVSDLGFVYNQTALTDVCLTPSLGETFGLFERPNAINVVHELFPIFSQSKVSSFADIVYPSPWYWQGKVSYSEAKDPMWDDKKERLYWRGSTTGGFSRNGGWRRHHRQRFVAGVNAADTAMVLANNGDQSRPDWQPREVPRADYHDLFDVHFSHVGQCDPGDCDAQKEAFSIVSHADQEDAFQYKHVVDLDGNAFSGRFYALLQSRSLVYKLVIFREWHAEWIRPWVHYIPLSFPRGDDWLEAVRFFVDEKLGRWKAERMAMQGREWANETLRKEDMEVWFFRYGRVIDDNRENLGYDG